MAKNRDIYISGIKLDTFMKYYEHFQKDQGQIEISKVVPKLKFNYYQITYTYEGKEYSELFTTPLDNFDKALDPSHYAYRQLNTLLNNLVLEDYIGDDIKSIKKLNSVIMPDGVNVINDIKDAYSISYGSFETSIDRPFRLHFIKGFKLEDHGDMLKGRLLDYEEEGSRINIYTQKYTFSSNRVTFSDERILYGYIRNVKDEDPLLVDYTGALITKEGDLIPNSPAIIVYDHETNSPNGILEFFTPTWIDRFDPEVKKYIGTHPAFNSEIYISDDRMPFNSRMKTQQQLVRDIVTKANDGEILSDKVMHNIFGLELTQSGSPQFFINHRIEEQTTIRKITENEFKTLHDKPGVISYIGPDYDGKGYSIKDDNDLVLSNSDVNIVRKSLYSMPEVVATPTEETLIEASNKMKIELEINDEIIILDRELFGNMTTATGLISIEETRDISEEGLVIRKNSLNINGHTITPLEKITDTEVRVYNTMRFNYWGNVIVELLNSNGDIVGPEIEFGTNTDGNYFDLIYIPESDFYLTHGKEIIWSFDNPEYSKGFILLPSSAKSISDGFAYKDIQEIKLRFRPDFLDVENKFEFKSLDGDVNALNGKNVKVSLVTEELLEGNDSYWILANHLSFRNNNNSIYDPESESILIPIKKDSNLYVYNKDKKVILSEYSQNQLNLSSTSDMIYIEDRPGFRVESKLSDDGNNIIWSIPVRVPRDFIITLGGEPSDKDRMFSMRIIKVDSLPDDLTDYGNDFYPVLNFGEAEIQRTIQKYIIPKDPDFLNKYTGLQIKKFPFTQIYNYYLSDSIQELKVIAHELSSGGIQKYESNTLKDVSLEFSSIYKLTIEIPKEELKTFRFQAVARVNPREAVREMIPTTQTGYQESDVQITILEGERTKADLYSEKPFKRFNSSLDSVDSIGIKVATTFHYDPDFILLREIPRDMHYDPMDLYRFDRYEELIVNSKLTPINFQSSSKRRSELATQIFLREIQDGTIKPGEAVSIGWVLGEGVWTGYHEYIYVLDPNFDGLDPQIVINKKKPYVHHGFEYFKALNSSRVNTAKSLTATSKVSPSYSNPLVNKTVTYNGINVEIIGYDYLDFPDWIDADKFRHGILRYTGSTIQLRRRSTGSLFKDVLYGKLLMKDNNVGEDLFNLRRLDLNQLIEIDYKEPFEEIIHDTLTNERYHKVFENKLPENFYYESVENKGVITLKTMEDLDGKMKVNPADIFLYGSKYLGYLEDIKEEMKYIVPVSTDLLTGELVYIQVLKDTEEDDLYDSYYTIYERFFKTPLMHVSTTGRGKLLTDNELNTKKKRVLEQLLIERLKDINLLDSMAVLPDFNKQDNIVMAKHLRAASIKHILEKTKTFEEFNRSGSRTGDIAIESIPPIKIILTEYDSGGREDREIKSVSKLIEVGDFFESLYKSGKPKRVLVEEIKEALNKLNEEEGELSVDTPERYGTTYQLTPSKPHYELALTEMFMSNARYIGKPEEFLDKYKQTIHIVEPMIERNISLAKTNKPNFKEFGEEKYILTIDNDSDITELLNLLSTGEWRVLHVQKKEKTKDTIS